MDASRGVASNGGIRWPAAVRRGLLATALAAALLTVTAPRAGATVTGGCIATGTSTSGGEVDLTREREWHLRSTDRISLAGSAPTPQTGVSVGASAFGFVIPLASAEADGATAGRSGDIDVRVLAFLGRVFLISGSSAGPAGGCAGEVLVILDDVNPLLTLLGGGALAALLLGVLGLVRAARGAVSLRRRAVGSVSLLLIGAGGSLLLQQGAALVDEAFGDRVAALAPARFADSVVAPAELRLDAVYAARAAILTALILLLLPFPSQLFNATLEQNLDRIRTGFGRLPVAGRLIRRPTAESLPAPAPGGWSRIPLALTFLLLAGLVYALLDPAFGPDGRSLVAYVGIVLSLAVVTWASALPARALHRRLTNDAGRLWIVPATLLIAAVCVLISRLVGYLPGYVYGLILGWAFATNLTPRDEGRAGALGAWWMLAVAFAAWFTLGAVRTPGVEDTVPGVIAEAVLAALVVAGIEGVVFALMPLRFLPGELVYRWHRLRWAVLYGIGLYAFVFVLLNPANGYLPPEGSVPFAVALALFVGFGIASLLFWGYFRLRPTRVAP